MRMEKILTTSNSAAAAVGSVNGNSATQLFPSLPYHSLLLLYSKLERKSTNYQNCYEKGVKSITTTKNRQTIVFFASLSIPFSSSASWGQIISRSGKRSSSNSSQLSVRVNKFNLIAPKCERRSGKLIIFSPEVSASSVCVMLAELKS